MAWWRLKEDAGKHGALAAGDRIKEADIPHGARDKFELVQGRPPGATAAPKAEPEPKADLAPEDDPTNDDWDGSVANGERGA